MIDEMKMEDAELIAKMKMDLGKTLLDFRHRWNISTDLTIRMLESVTADYWLVQNFTYRNGGAKIKD